MPESSEDAREKRGCLKGCLIGCGVLILLGIGLSVGGPLLMMRPFQRAIDTRQELDQRFGEQDAYTPAADGSIAAARIEVFLAVRSELAGVCAEMTASFTQMKSMERFDDQEEVSRSEVLREAVKTVRSAFGVPVAMAGLFETRNRALLEAEMGLGEYTYIYVMAFHQLLLEENEYDELMDDEAINSRVSAVLRELLRRQLVALRETPADPAGAAVLEAEIDALERDRDRIPWQDGLPAAIASSLEPYRTRLDESFCPATAAIDLRINERQGVVSIELR
jgi:hypothetical protein